ncbi:MAG: hypothetical protein H0U04_19870 [Rubrobacter sp.]|nr:hypothetical protein [Rubrobacter sp.]
MGSMRRRLKRLERLSEDKMIVIPQRDRTVKKFPQSARAAAFTNIMDRMGAGEDAPPEHPLTVAARNSSDCRWSESVFAGTEEGGSGPIEDLSES